MLHGILQPDVAVVAEPVSNQEAGRPQCGGIERGDLVGGQHFLDHSVVGLVRVRGFDDPVAPAPDVRLAFPHLGIVPRPVAVAPDVHPMPTPAFAMAGAGQQIFHDREVTLFSGLRGVLRQFLRCWRNPDQIHVDPPEQHMWRSGLLRDQAMRGMLSGEKGVDRIPNPRLVRRHRDRRLHDWTERPMRTRITVTATDWRFVRGSTREEHGAANNPAAETPPACR